MKCDYTLGYSLEPLRRAEADYWAEIESQGYSLEPLRRAEIEALKATPRQYWWGCAESHSGSGRPSRVWAEATNSPDVRPDTPDVEGNVPYPFNGMGGFVEAGPFASEQEAIEAVDAMIYSDSAGYLQWR